MTNPKEMKPSDYHEQDGCYNCNHVFRELNYECGPTLFCHWDNSERPPCTNPKMKEVLGILMMDELYSIYDAWWDWSEPREVVAWGKCNKYTRHQGGHDED